MGAYAFDYPGLLGRALASELSLGSEFCSYHQSLRCVLSANDTGHRHGGGEDHFQRWRRAPRG